MGFFVDPGSVRGLADAFEAAANGLSGRVEAFAERAPLKPEAFGRLASSDGVRAQYAAKLEHGLGSLGQLQRTLAQFAASLKVTADNYEAADRGGPPGGVSP
jgi:hypothetical protein